MGRLGAGRAVISESVPGVALLAIALQGSRAPPIVFAERAHVNTCLPLPSPIATKYKASPGAGARLPATLLAGIAIGVGGKPSGCRCCKGCRSTGRLCGYCRRTAAHAVRSRSGRSATHRQLQAAATNTPAICGTFAVRRRFLFDDRRERQHLLFRGPAGRSASRCCRRRRAPLHCGVGALEHVEVAVAAGVDIGFPAENGPRACMPALAERLHQRGHRRALDTSCFNGLALAERRAIRGYSILPRA